MTTSPQFITFHITQAGRQKPYPVPYTQILADKYSRDASKKTLFWPKLEVSGEKLISVKIIE